MTTANLTPIAIAALDPALAGEITLDTDAGWTAFEAEAPHATVSNQRLQIVHSAAYCRAGVVFVGSGSSGLAAWTDADTPEEALRRYLDDEMTP